MFGQITEKQRRVNEYGEVLGKLKEVMPREKLKLHLSVWLTNKLTLEEKIIEANYLLSKWNKRKKPGFIESEFDFIFSYFRTKK